MKIVLILNAINIKFTHQRLRIQFHYMENERLYLCEQSLKSLKIIADSTSFETELYDYTHRV